MGNFSVNHYSRLEVTATGVQLRYVLDLAEIPTLELFQRWQVSDRSAAGFQAAAEAKADGLLAGLIVESNGERRRLQAGRVEARLSDGAGGMQTARIAIDADVPAAPGGFSYEDRNYAGRTGWKEIVIRGGGGISLQGAMHGSSDLSHELTIYPADLSLAPPQDLQTSFSWVAAAPAPAGASGASTARAAPAGRAAAPTVPIAAPPPSANAVRPFAPASQAPGTVVAGDFLSRMLSERRFGVSTILLGILTAFGLGAMHALSPGHGKTIVAAYLVGSRGTLKHALLLGSTVTFTHTVSVFLLGIGVLSFQQYFVPERAIPMIGAISGLSIVLIGGWLLRKRALALMNVGAPAGHTHAHNDHDHHHHDHSIGHHHHSGQAAAAILPALNRAASGVAVLEVPAIASPSGNHATAHSRGAGHSHEHGHSHSHSHEHASGFVHTHSHDGSTHSHSVPEGPVGLGGLIALGVSGGLVPCPSALILLLSAIALGQTSLGLVLLLAFSLGLALVLMAIGALVVYAKHMVPRAQQTQRHAMFRLIPLFSAVAVIVMGVLMTMTALGLIGPIRYIG